jgi:Bacterial regulatory protein, arsR family.
MIEEAAHRFALLGDQTRLRILHAVMERGELSVGTIAEAAGASRFNTSAHLNRLALGGNARVAQSVAVTRRPRQGGTLSQGPEADLAQGLCPSRVRLFASRA